MATSSPRRTFDAVLQSGHKQCAVEVPFDPAEAWALSAQPLWPGRRGYRVSASCSGIDFDSVVVSRSRRYWLLIDEEVRRTAGWREGGNLRVSLVPKTPAHA